MKKFLLNLQFIFRPRYWLMYYSYNKEIDNIINSLLDKYEFSQIFKFSDVLGYTAFLGDIKIWIENRSYICYIAPYEFIHKYRPSRITTLKGIRKLNEKIKENELAEINDFKKSIKYHESN